MSEEDKSTPESTADHSSPAGTFPWPPEKVARYAHENTQRIRIKGHWGTRFGIWLLLKFVRAFSRRGAWRFGGLIGRLMYRLRIRRSTAMINLDIVYGDGKTQREKDAIYKGCLINVARQAVNYLRVPLLDDRFWREGVTIRNEAALAAAYNRGRGVIILSMHYGAWELPGGKFGLSGYPISNIVKIIDNPVVERFLIDARLTMNLGSIPHKRSMERIVEGLRRGEGIIMAVDQNMTRRLGVFVDWFGRPASTIRSCAYLAKETGAAVVAGYSRQFDADHIEVVVIGEIPWEAHPDDPEREMSVNTRNYIAPFEKPIYDEPEGWLWLHRRWKVQPEGTPNPYK